MCLQTPEWCQSGVCSRSYTALVGPQESVYLVFLNDLRKLLRSKKSEKLFSYTLICCYYNMTRDGIYRQKLQEAKTEARLKQRVNKIKTF